MLVGILASKFRGTGIDELDKWEGAIKVYQDSSGEQVSDAIRIATVMNNLQEGPLLSRLQLNSDRYEKYSEFKSVIENYYRSKKAWTAQGTPMDVDALQKGPRGGKKSKEEKEKERLAAEAFSQRQGKGR